MKLTKVRDVACRNRTDNEELVENLQEVRRRLETSLDDIPPDLEQPTEVDVDLYIKAISDVSVSSMDYWVGGGTVSPKSQLYLPVVIR